MAALEVKGGEIIVPFSITDVMDTVEEYMGSEVRQYLEEYLLDNIADTQEMEREAQITEDNAQEIVGHYRDVLNAIDEIVETLGTRLLGSRIDRKGIAKQLDGIHNMIQREL